MLHEVGNILEFNGLLLSFSLSTPHPDAPRLHFLFFVTVAMVIMINGDIKVAR